MAKSHSFPEEKERDGVIRVDSFQQSCLMRSDGKVGSKGDTFVIHTPYGFTKQLTRRERENEREREVFFLCKIHKTVSC